MFDPGDIVECIAHAPASDPRPNPPCVPGGVYTVDEFRPFGRLVEGGNGLRLQRDTLALAGFDHSFLRFEGRWTWGPFASNFRLLKRRDAALMLRLMTEPTPDELTDEVEAA